MVDSASAQLSAEESALIERLATEVVRRRMTVPAILFLESMKPLTFLGSQTLYFFEPMVRAITSRSEYRTATTLLEDRDKIEHLLRRIEALEAAGLGRVDHETTQPEKTQENPERTRELT